RRAKSLGIRSTAYASGGAIYYYFPEASVHILHRSVTSAEFDDHLAERRPRLHGLERLAEFLERHDLADHGLQLARCQPVEQLRDQAGMRLRLALLDLGEIDAEQSAALQEREVEGQRRNGARGKAD